MALLRAQAGSLREFPDADARTLGTVVGRARADGQAALAELFRTAVAPTWARAFLNGLFDSWPNAMRSLELVRHLLSDRSPLAAALEESLGEGSWELRWPAARAVGLRAARGHVSALRAIERMTLDEGLTPSQRGKMADLFADSAVQAIPRLARGTDVQEAVDVAVGLVDVCLKTGNTAPLDRALSAIDPEVLPAEIVLAFLTTSKPASAQLPARANLIGRFEDAIRARGRTDADALMRFAR